MAIHLPTRQPQEHHPEPKRPRRGDSGYQAFLAAAIIVAVLAIATLIGIVFFNDDGSTETTTGSTVPVSTIEPSAPDQPSTGAGGPSQTPTTGPGPTASPKATTASSTTAATTPKTTAEPPIGSSTVAASGVPPSDVDQPVVWPQSSLQPGFVTPEAAARSFAEVFAGFDAPVLGDFRAGDGRSGEIEVQPRDNGPVTTLLLRQVGPDDSWSVIAATSENIVIDQPTAGALVGQPMTLAGKGRAFEGTINFELYAHGQSQPVATGYVTGRGDGILGPFATTVEWPTTLRGAGTLLLVTNSAENGQVWDVAAIPIEFP